MSLDNLNNETLSTLPDNDGDEAYSAFEQVSKKEEADKPKKKLSKQKWIIMLTSGLALLLVAALLILLLVPPATKPDPVEPDDTDKPTSVTLLDKTQKGKTVVQQIDIKNKDDSYTIYYDEKKSSFLLKGYEDISLNAEIIDTLIGCTTSLVASDTVKQPEALSVYGLDKPQSIVTIRYKDGETAQLSIGVLVPTEDGYYVSTDMKNGVYIFSSETTSMFLFRSVAFADTTLISTPSVKKDDANGSALLKEVSFSGTKHPTPLRIRRSYHTDSEEVTLFSYIIDRPYVRGTNDAAMGELGNFKGLAASQVLILHPTQKEKEKLGFNNPLIIADITMAVETGEDIKDGEETSINTYYNETTSKIIVGSIDAGDYVVMMDGIDAIFLVSRASFAAIAERTYMNSVSQLLFLKNIGDLGRISITVNGKTSDFNLAHFPNKEDDDKKLKVTVDGKKYPTPDFRELYQLLMGLERYDTPDRKPEGKPIMEIQMYTNDGEAYLGAKYYPLSGALCAVVTTEGEVFTTRWHNVTHFTEQVENYLNGDKVLMLT